MVENPSPSLIATGDASALFILGTTIVGWLPSIATIISIVWFGIQVWESKTVQGWVLARRHKKWLKKNNQP